MHPSIKILLLFGIWLIFIPAHAVTEEPVPGVPVLDVPANFGLPGEAVPADDVLPQEDEADEPHRGYYIELIVFRNDTFADRGTQDNNRFTLPDRRPTDRSRIYPAITGELFANVPKLTQNNLYTPIAYTAWRQISKPRGDSPRFQLNEIAPGLTGWIMVYDNVILLTEIDLEYSPVAGSAAVYTGLLSLPQSAQPEDTAYSFDGGSESDMPEAEASQHEYQGEYFPTPHSASTAYTYKRIDPTTPHYRIKEKRRIRFEETHYFDHPAFGLLLRVVRTEVKQQEPDLARVEAADLPPFSEPIDSQPEPFYFEDDPFINTRREDTTNQVLDTAR